MTEKNTIATAIYHYLADNPDATFNEVRADLVATRVIPPDNIPATYMRACIRNWRATA